MKQLLIFILTLFSTILSNAQTNKLAFNFTYDTVSAVLDIRLELKGTDSGKTFLRLPDKFANEKELYKAIQFLKVQSKGATLHPTENPAVQYVLHKPNQKIEITYCLKQDWEGEFYHPRNYRAVINKRYLQLTSSALLILPQDDSTKLVQVKMDWSGLPKNWKVYNSLHANTTQYSGVLSLEKLQNTFYVAGDFRGYLKSINNKPVFVAVRGSKWKFKDEEIVDKAIATINMQREFWRDHSEDYYFVSLIPFDGKGTYNGTSMYQSFMLGLSEDYPINTAVLSLLSHEYFHRWNGNMITLDGEEFENKWFSEGFTEYYSYKLLYASKMIPLTDYINSINQHIADYYLSPVRNEQNSNLAKNYWNTRDYNHLPYKKGFVYALYLDQQIHSKTKGTYSLDNVMLEMAKAKNNNQKITIELFIKLVKQYSGKDISDWQKEYITGGATIPVATVSFSQQVDYEIKTLGSFDIGFNLDASWKAREIIEIKENSEAWLAGIRNGQKIKGYSISYDDITKPAEISIEENGTIKKVAFIPMSVNKVQVPQFSLK